MVVWLSQTKPSPKHFQLYLSLKNISMFSWQYCNGVTHWKGKMVLFFHKCRSSCLFAGKCLTGPLRNWKPGTTKTWMKRNILLWKSNKLFGTNLSVFILFELNLHRKGDTQNYMILRNAKYSYDIRKLFKYAGNFAQLFASCIVKHKNVFWIIIKYCMKLKMKKFFKKSHRFIFQ